MADDPARPPSRAHPVAELPLERLEARVEALARRWGAQLVLERPLGALGRIALEELTREAPDLCRQVLRAVSSEAELDRLLGSETPERGSAYADRAAALSGAREAGGAIAAVESLRGVLWEGLLDELGGAADRRQARLLGDVADRLAHVCAVLAAAAADRDRPVAAGRPARFPERPPGPRVAPESRIVIVDERGDAETSPESGAAAEEQPPGRASEISRPDRSGDPGQERAGRAREGRAASVPVHAAVHDAPGPVPARAEIAIRDARGEAGPVAWIHSIGEHLDRFERDGLPFAVVLMEVAGSGSSLQRPAETEIETALSAGLRDAGGGTLTKERDGRYWLLAARADRIGAHTLASRLERGVAAAAARAGIAVVVTTGTAICPEDGTQAAALAAQADVGLYAARWEARSQRMRERTAGEEV